MGILVWLVLLAMIVIQIIVAIKMFKTAGAVHGILGILCGLYAFIWGWMNANKLNIKNLMIIWTVLLILYFILAFTVGFNFAVGTSPTAVP